MDRYRRDAGWKAFSAFLVLGLGIIAFVVWAALSAVHADENNKCQPFDEGFNGLVALAMVSHGSLYKVPADKMKAWAERLKDQWDGLDGDSAFIIDLPTAYGVFVKRGDQLCAATLKQTPNADDNGI